MLRFLNQLNKCQKLKKKFVAHFHEAFRSCPLTPFNLRREIKYLIKLHNLYKFLEDIKFGTNFIDPQKLA